VSGGTAEALCDAAQVGAIVLRVLGSVLGGVVGGGVDRMVDAIEKAACS
jgi:hypothetical protein